MLHERHLHWNTSLQILYKPAQYFSLGALGGRICCEGWQWSQWLGQNCPVPGCFRIKPLLLKEESSTFQSVFFFNLLQLTVSLVRCDAFLCLLSLTPFILPCLPPSKPPSTKCVQTFIRKTATYLLTLPMETYRQSEYKYLYLSVLHLSKAMNTE